VIRRDAISSGNRALIALRRHGPRLREAPRVTRLVSASARRPGNSLIYAPCVLHCRPPTLPLRRAGPSTYPFAAQTRASRQLQKSKVRSHSETERTPSHCICASGQAVVGVHVSAAASSAQAANVSFGVMDLNVSRCKKQLHRSSLKLNCNPVLFLTVPQDLSSVASFAAAYDQPAIDVLICNAGIMNTPFALSKASNARPLSVSAPFILRTPCCVSGWHRAAVSEQPPRPLQTREAAVIPCPFCDLRAKTRLQRHLTHRCADPPPAPKAARRRQRARRFPLLARPHETPRSHRLQAPQKRNRRVV
jgi:hypothetical protein